MPENRLRVVTTAAWMACALAGCATAPDPVPEKPPVRFEIAGVDIRNELDYPVTDVQVLVHATGGLVSCGTVFPDSSCATSFPLREYRGDAISVSWEERGEPRSIEDFELEPPRGLDTRKPVWVQIVVYSPGNAGARVLSEQPSRR
ncbi:hypothetical protein [Elongatibacter sediminis]|uniref:Lipoprotein n=1 Tax=Elongatibacter sediminis TaxID=3119006 RepID=A0AAW9RMF4_9GAMM